MAGGAHASGSAATLRRWAGPPWRWLNRRTLSGRLITGVVLLLALACAVIGITTYLVLGKSLIKVLDGQLEAASGRYASCIEHGGQPPASGSDGKPVPCNVGMDQAPGTFGARAKDGTFTSAKIVNGVCDLSATDMKTLNGLHTYHGIGNAPTYTLDLKSLDGDYRVTAVAGDDGDVLYTGLPLSSVENTQSDVLLAEVIVFASVLVLTGVLGMVWVRISLRPLRRVAATATQVTELPLETGEVALPQGVPYADPRTEVGQVGAAFNRMLGHVEAALARRAASESRLRRFAADASHELRTPLSAIRGYSELALRNHGPVPEEVTHALKRVESESARMSVLVDDLLLLARLDAGRPLARDPVDLTRLAIDTTSDAQVARNDHRWLLELPDEPVMVRGDDFRLHQVLANLLSNAGKHTPAGSTVTVSLAAASEQPWVELSVMDDGPGIPADLVPDLFERFVRADTARSHEAGSGSTGLGLAIVDAVVTAHRGSVGVTSRPGRTIFTIRLPRLEDEPARAGTAPPSASRGYSHRHR
jgi:two-component system OmpR family sensor kinase